MPDPMDDQTLHELVREGLRERASEADTSPAVVARVTSVPRSRRAAWAVGGAAVAVAATVTAVAVLGDQAPGPGGESPPVAGSEEPGDVPADWRSESWEGLTVSVPPDWGYGGAPGDDGVACFPSAMKSAEGRPNRDESGPYVGRPITVTDVCVGDLDEGPLADPTAPYVWLGSGVDVGTDDLGDGWVRETVAAYGSTVSVTTNDESLRARILGSARPTELCEAELPGVPEPSRTSSREGLIGFAPDRLSVCAYRREAGTGPVTLSYAAELDDRAAAAYAPIAGGEQERLRCGSAEGGFEWVVLRFEGQDPYGTDRMFHEVVVHLGGAGCPRVQTDPGTALTLSAGLVEPWATGGIPAVVYGPSGGKGAMIDSFIGPQG